MRVEFASGIVGCFAFGPESGSAGSSLRSALVLLSSAASTLFCA